MPDRARAAALTVTETARHLPKEDRMLKYPESAPIALPCDEICAGSFQFHSACQHNNIETSPRRALGLRFAYAAERGLNSTGILARLPPCGGVGPLSAKNEQHECNTKTS